MPEGSPGFDGVTLIHVEGNELFTSTILKYVIAAESYCLKCSLQEARYASYFRTARSNHSKVLFHDSSIFQQPEQTRLDEW
jgi:hypothetical protein